MRNLVSGFLLLLILSPLPAQESAEPGLSFSDEEQRLVEKALRFENEMVKLAAQIRPSSVSIENWQGGGPRGSGSGVIVSTKGYVFTNQHVVQGAEQVWVVLHDHRRVEAQIVGSDKRGDIALLLIDVRRIKHASPTKAQPDRLSAGEWVIATGNPFGLARDGEPIVTLGVISGLGRIAPGEFFYGKAIQHDARINPGNSGGPLWDTAGTLLGINGKISSNKVTQARASSEGVSYTIPIDQVRNFLDAMLDGTSAGHGHELIGLQVETAKDDTGANVGAVVKKVVPGSPAANARAGGVKPGDVVWKITVKGKPSEVRSVTDYLNVLSPLAEGSKVTLHIQRGKKRMVLPNILLSSGKKGRKR